MRVRLFLCVALVAASPTALAQSRVTAPEFEALAEGRTLYFSRGGAPYGAEQYLPGRLTIWRYADGTCANGRWFPVQDLICFVYENEPQRVQCWIFERREGTYYARPDGTPPESFGEIEMSGSSRAPLICNAPDLGV